MKARLHRNTLAVFFLCLLASCLVNAANNLAPRATVDRTVINEGDSLTLTVRIDNTGSYDTPDYSPLQKDFEIYGTRQSNQHSINNGRMESRTEWQTTLVPKRSGQLQIPSLSVAGTQTQPITIQVNAQSQSSAGNGSEPVFIEVQTDNNSVYVQQQILLTARVYIAVQLDNMQLTKPEFDNANVKQLAENTFNRSVNGTPYEVHELTYAIFPQQPGELTIPELVFNAVEITSSRSMFDFAGRGRAIRKISKQINVSVKPIPKSFTGSFWLPARNLTLTESWSGDQQHLSVGDSITRNIAIRADGLLASQLPELDQPRLDAAKLYADQPTLDDAADTNGVHGKRVENSALIPSRAGQLQLPETRVVWWDIDSDSEKVATLPSETLTIAAGANTANTPSLAPQTQPTDQQTVTMQPQIDGPAPTTTVSAATNKTLLNKTLLWWQIATAMLTLLWLVTLLAYWQLRRQPRTNGVTNLTQDRDNGDEQNAWRDFTAACRANNPAAARQKLLQWATLFPFSENEQIHSIEQLLRIVANQSLTRELQLLDNRLFGTLHDSSDWNGENLLQVVQEIKKSKPRKNTPTDEALPPLYPAA